VESFSTFRKNPKTESKEQRRQKHVFPRKFASFRYPGEWYGTKFLLYPAWLVVACPIPLIIFAFIALPLTLVNNVPYFTGFGGYVMGGQKGT